MKIAANDVVMINSPTMVKAVRLRRGKDRLRDDERAQRTAHGQRVLRSTATVAGACWSETGREMQSRLLFPVWVDPKVWNTTSATQRPYSNCQKGRIDKSLNLIRLTPLLKSIADWSVILPAPQGAGSALTSAETGGLYLYFLEGH
jgi:hypothetical protein